MNRFLNKWTRQIHRWFAYPFIVLVLAIIFSRQTDIGMVLTRVQQAMVLVMAVTGAYLLILPYYSKRWRTIRKTQQKD